MKIERIICSECGYRVKPEKIRDEEIATIIDGLSGCLLYTSDAADEHIQV